MYKSGKVAEKVGWKEGRKDGRKEVNEESKKEEKRRKVCRKEGGKITTNGCLRCFVMQLHCTVRHYVTMCHIVASYDEQCYTMSYFITILYYVI